MVIQFKKKYNVSIEIPEGYIIESTPKPINLVMTDNLGTFTFKIISSENKIQVAVTFEINSAIVAPDYYEGLKDFYKQMIGKLTEKIVLKKA